MHFIEFKELTTVLFNVVAGISHIKRIEKDSDDSNRLSVVYLNRQEKEEECAVVLLDDKKTIRAFSLGSGIFSNYTIAVERISVLQEYRDQGTTRADLSRVILSKEELIRRIKNDEITFDLKGHYAGFNGNNDPMIEFFKDEIVTRIETEIDGAAGKFDNTWSESSNRTMEEANRSMRDFYRIRLDRGVRKNDNILDSGTKDVCSSCGRSYQLVMQDENTITVYPDFNMKKAGDFTLECEFPKGPPSTKGEIKVESDLIFVNYIKYLKGDCPEDKKYSKEFSLNTWNGRKNITKWKSENQNVAYGQMGNMSLSVYINDEKDHIILTEAWIEEEEKENKLKEMGMKQVGKRISLSVWRWEATDMKTLEKASGKDQESIKKDMEDDKYDNSVIVPAKHGTWEFIHYYDTTPDPEDENDLFIYAELKLKK